MIRSFSQETKSPAGATDRVESKGAYGEVLRVAAYAALVALPFAAVIPMISTVGVPLAVAATAAIFWSWMAKGRKHISLLRGAAIGALVGVAYHMIYSVGYSLYDFFRPSSNLGLIEAFHTSVKMGLIMTLFGSVVSMPVGILAFVCYVRFLRPRIAPSKTE